MPHRTWYFLGRERQVIAPRGYGHDQATRVSRSSRLMAAPYFSARRANLVCPFLWQMVQSNRTTTHG